jgi:DNA-binding response OmpR family regulator
MNILVADDSRLDRMLIETILKKNHYKVITAKDGDEALSVYKNESIDLAILDWMMPPTGGLKLCKEIRDIESKSESFCFIIMVTGKMMVEDEVRAFDVGVNDFISKPFDEAILVARVKAGIKIINDRNELINHLNK